MKKKEKYSSKEAKGSKKSLLPQVIDSKPKLPMLTKGSVSSSDPLKRYLDEISQYPVMDPEEQQRLAIKFLQTGDVSIARALVTTNLRLVVKIGQGLKRKLSF